MNKQTAVEFMIEQFETMFKINGVEISPRYRIETISPIYQKALELEREQYRISDEEIIKASDGAATFAPSFIRGAQWYREQLK